MVALYNEIDDYAADWLENLIAAGLIAPGIVDRRSIVDLQPADLAGFTQVHFFAGIGGWSLAARLAGWPDDRPLWTGSCPCQPFSVAGKQKGQEDERHLWPIMFELIRACRPDVVMGEQVAAAVGKSWLDGVFSDLEGIGYATGAAVVPACAVDAPHRRDRLWFVADCTGGGTRSVSEGIQTRQSEFSQCSHVADCNEPRASQERQQRSGQLGRIGSDPQPCRSDVSHSERVHDDRTGHGASDVRGQRSEPSSLQTRAPFWSDFQFITGADGKARRVKPGVRLLAHGVPARVGKLRAFGNAIVPQVAPK